MLTVRDYIDINRNHIRRAQRALRMIDRGKLQEDEQHNKEKYAAQIVLLTEETEYLRRFAPEHVLTSSEVREYRAIAKGRRKI